MSRTLTGSFRTPGFRAFTLKSFSDISRYAPARTRYVLPFIQVRATHRSGTDQFRVLLAAPHKGCEPIFSSSTHICADTMTFRWNGYLLEEWLRGSYSPDSARQCERRRLVQWIGFFVCLPGKCAYFLICDVFSLLPPQIHLRLDRHALRRPLVCWQCCVIKRA